MQALAVRIAHARVQAECARKQYEAEKRALNLEMQAELAQLMASYRRHKRRGKVENPRKSTPSQCTEPREVTYLPAGVPISVRPGSPTLVAHVSAPGAEQPAGAVLSDAPIPVRPGSPTPRVAAFDRLGSPAASCGVAIASRCLVQRAVRHR